MAQDANPVDDPGSGDRQHPPTIYDIARVTGYNPSTVSRALHKPGRVSAKTADQIRAAADALGYRPNVFARALPTGLTGNIALILSDITNPAFFDLPRHRLSHRLIGNRLPGLRVPLREVQRRGREDGVSCRRGSVQAARIPAPTSLPRAAGRRVR